MNRTQKFALNSITAAMTQIVAMIVGFITPRVMIMTYGSEINGLVSSLHQFISYITLVEAGIGGAAIYSLYKPLAQKDELGISRIVKAAKKSYFQAGYIFSTGIFFMALFYGILCSTETLGFWTIFPLALLLGTNGCLNFFLLSGYTVLLTADQKNFVISTITIVQTILRTVIVCGLAYFKTNVVLLYALALIPLVLRTVLLLVYCKKNYPYIRSDVVPDKTSLNKRWDVIYQQILGTVQVGAPTVIATVILNFAMVSVFSVYNMVLTGINGVLGIFTSGLPAGFGELIAKNEKETLKKSVSEFEVAYYYILTVVYGVTMAMILPFVSVYTKGFTDVNYYYPALAFVIVLNGLLYNIKTPQSMLIISAGMYKETRWKVTVQGVIIIVFGILLGIPFGLVGIMIGSCLSNLYRTIDLLYFTPKYITGIKYHVAPLRMLRVIITITLIALPALILNVQVDSYLSWVLYAIVFGIYALIITTIITVIFDKKDFLALCNRVKNMVFRRK